MEMKHTKKKYLFFFSITFSLVVFSIFLYRYSKNNPVLNSKYAYECKERIKETWMILDGYISANGDLPRDDEGHFSPESLLCHQTSQHNCVPSSNSHCTLATDADKDWEGLIWCGDVSKEQVSNWGLGHPISKRYVLLCHTTKSLHRVGSKVFALILISDGSVPSIEVNIDSYQSWLEKDFLLGNNSLPTFAIQHFQDD